MNRYEAIARKCYLAAEVKDAKQILGLLTIDDVGQNNSIGAGYEGGKRGSSVTIYARALLAAVFILIAWHTPVAHAESISFTPQGVTDAALLHALPGFESGYAIVNGTRIHYVVGGHGDPLVLLPGWPETWWEFHQVMPALAREYRVIVVDLRGMGDSAKPVDGYDKKTMARDVFELVRRLGYNRVNIAGHDIGSMVAFSFAANHPEATGSLR